MKMVFDSDMIQGGTKVKNTILANVLKAGKPVTVIHGAAGSGKSTMVDGEFITNETKIGEADEFIVISGASATKSGEPSEAVANLFKQAGRVIFLVPANMEIIRRRMNRANVGSNDTRSHKQLVGTMRAPLNNWSFIAKLRKIAKNSKIVS